MSSGVEQKLARIDRLEGDELASTLYRMCSGQKIGSIILGRLIEQVRRDHVTIAILCDEAGLPVIESLAERVKDIDGAGDVTCPTCGFQSEYARGHIWKCRGECGTAISISPDGVLWTGTQRGVDESDGSVPCSSDFSPNTEPDLTIIDEVPPELSYREAHKRDFGCYPPDSPTPNTEPAPEGGEPQAARVASGPPEQQTLGSADEHLSQDERDRAFTAGGYAELERLEREAREAADRDPDPDPDLKSDGPSESDIELRNKNGVETEIGDPDEEAAEEEEIASQEEEERTAEEAADAFDETEAALEDDADERPE